MPTKLIKKTRGKESESQVTAHITIELLVAATRATGSKNIEVAHPWFDRPDPSARGRRHSPLPTFEDQVRLTRAGASVSVPALRV